MQTTERVQVVRGIEVDVTVRSHDMPPEVLKGIEALKKQKRTNRAVARILGIHENMVRTLLVRKTCAPDLLIRLINNLPQTEKTEA